MSSVTTLFASFNDCGTVNPAPQGIVGFGPAGGLSTGTNGYFDQLVASAHTANVFAMKLCPTGGTLWLGGYDPMSVSAPPQFTPITSDDPYHYNVDLISITVAGQTIPVATTDVPSTSIDSGSNSFILPVPAFQAVKAALIADPSFISIFGSDQSDAGTNDGGSVGDGGPDPGSQVDEWFSATNVCASFPQSQQELDSMLPRMTLTIGTNPSIQIDVPATQAYLSGYHIEPYGDVWCNSLAAIPGVSVMGATILRSQVVIVDRANRRIGFAPNTGCP
jgi:hypothetical protein